MASGEGFGRGGRGAALLQALAQKSRKPGQMEEEEKEVKFFYYFDKCAPFKFSFYLDDNLASAMPLNESVEAPS